MQTDLGLENLWMKLQSVAVHPAVCRGGGPSLWALHSHLPSEFIQNHTQGLSQCWCVSGNLTPIDLRWTGHSGLSGGWQMTQQQRICCCHNMTTSLALWASLWSDLKTFVVLTSLMSHPGRAWTQELLSSILFDFSLICLQALSKTNCEEQILYG